VGKEEYYIRLKLGSQATDDHENRAGDHTAKFYGYEKGWSTYVTNLVGCIALPCGHYPAEQAPDETYENLRDFFSR
jgi:hypothetical protein